ILLSPHISGAVHVTGLIDCGRAGIGDRHQDVALAIRSLTYNWGPEAVAPFLASYGWPSIDPRTTEFFTVLDEFF
ncbi:MAG TPA: phosphotransferase, partial [Gemmatimonas sp.]|nr:phosphotransferase [Gemmatimonas sp.]